MINFSVSIGEFLCLVIPCLLLGVANVVTFILSNRKGKIK